MSFVMFWLVWVFIAVVFVMVFGVIIFVIVKSTRESAANRAAPEVTAIATVIGKRVETSGGGDFAVTHVYHVAFEQPNGARFELEVPEAEYGILMPGDRGSVAMRGTRYLGFARELMR